MGSPGFTENGGPNGNGGGGGGGEGGGDRPPFWPGPWNVLGIGTRDSSPSPRDIRRHTPVDQLLADLTARLATRTKPESPKFQANVARLAAATDISEAATILGIDTGLKTRNVIRALRAILGLGKLGLRAIERGNAPDLSVLATASAAGSAGPTPFPVLPPQPPPPGTTPGIPQPRPIPTPRAPPGLPSGWWDWQLWQRALYGAVSLAGLFRRQPAAGGVQQFRFPQPGGALPAPIFNPQPAPPPGAGTTVGGSVPIHDPVFGDSGGFDFGGLIETLGGVATSIWGPQGGGGVQPMNIVQPQFPGVAAGVSPGVLGAVAGTAASGLFELFSGGNGAPEAGQFFKVSEQRLLPRARIDQVGPDGRSYTWFRAVPYGWKVRGTKVGGRKRHHHHYRKR